MGEFSPTFPSLPTNEAQNEQFLQNQISAFSTQNSNLCSSLSSLQISYNLLLKEHSKLKEFTEDLNQNLKTLKENESNEIQRLKEENKRLRNYAKTSIPSKTLESVLSQLQKEKKKVKEMKKKLKAIGENKENYCQNENFSMEKNNKSLLSDHPFLHEELLYELRRSSEYSN